MRPTSLHDWRGASHECMEQGESWGEIENLVEPTTCANEPMTRGILSFLASVYLGGLGHEIELLLFSLFVSLP